MIARVPEDVLHLLRTGAVFKTAISRRYKRFSSSILTKSRSETMFFFDAGPAIYMFLAAISSYSFKVIRFPVALAEDADEGLLLNALHEGFYIPYT